MPSLTEDAAGFLEAALERVGRPEAAVRLARRHGGGWSLWIDEVKEGDEVVERQGRVLLVVAEEVAEDLGDLLIDLNEADEPPRLVISRS